MKKILCAYLFFLSFQLFIESSEEERPFDRVVGLGGRCEVACQLNINELKGPTLPFDRLVSRFESLYAFIENEGEGFLEWNSFSRSSSQTEAFGVFFFAGLVVDDKYGFILPHDFDLNKDLYEQYPTQKSKYERRINRFFTLLNSEEKLLLIRLHITYDQAVRLDQLIHSKFPSLDYLLIAIDDSEEMKVEWNLNRIRNFYIPRQPCLFTSWEGDRAAWNAILKQFKIKKPNKSEENAISDAN